MIPAISPIFRQYEVHIGSVTIYPAIWQAIAIVILLFFLVITMAQVRRHFIEWSFHGAALGVLLGFILTLIIEGFFLVAGRTILTETLGWKNPPKPIAAVLGISRERLVDALETTGEISNIKAQEQTASYQSVVDLYSKLTPADSKKVKFAICTP